MCNALRLYFRRENKVRRYKTIHRFLHIKTYVCEHKISSRRASNERPYGIVQTVAILRSGMICFLILQPTSMNKNNIRNGQEKSKRRIVRFKSKICEIKNISSEIQIIRFVRYVAKFVQKHARLAVIGRNMG